MFYIILTMFAGAGIGYLLRNAGLHSRIGKAVSATIYIMLFFLGVKIGTNQEIIRNLSGIGLQALLLAVAGITGSILFSVIVYKVFFKGDRP